MYAGGVPAAFGVTKSPGGVRRSAAADKPDVFQFDLNVLDFFMTLPHYPSQSNMIYERSPFATFVISRGFSFIIYNALSFTISESYIVYCGGNGIDN